jgi:hypothetical protein
MNIEKQGGGGLATESMTITFSRQFAANTRELSAYSGMATAKLVRRSKRLRVVAPGAAGGRWRTDRDGRESPLAVRGGLPSVCGASSLRSK